MAYSPPLDGFVGVLIFKALITGIVAFLVVTVIETILLWRLQLGSFLFSLLTSFVINLASTFIGSIISYVFYFFILISFPYQTSFTLDAVFYYGLLRFFILLFLTFLISIAVEGGIMQFMKRSGQRGRETWMVAITANLVTYSMLAIAILVYYPNLF